MPDVRIRDRRRTRWLGAALALGAAPWLSGGSCTVVACYEDCDPCFEQCQCSSQCDRIPALSAGGDEPYRIAGFTSRAVPDGAGRVLRVLGDVVGPSLELARTPGAAPESRQDAELALFARRVLAVNTDLFPKPPGARWVLDGVELFPSAGVVGFHLGLPSDASDGPRPVHSSSVSLLFDRRGSLVEVGQVFERGPS